MNPIAIIDKFYPEENELKHILLDHSRSVSEKALEIAHRHPELQLDIPFLGEAAMLHDVGIFLVPRLRKRIHRYHKPAISRPAQCL